MRCARWLCLILCLTGCVDPIEDECGEADPCPIGKQCFAGFCITPRAVDAEQAEASPAEDASDASVDASADAVVAPDDATPDGAEADLGAEDASPDGTPDAEPCEVSPELCNGLDDDCDGETDEGNPICAPSLNAEGVCRGMEGCERVCRPGWIDVDRNRENGCERGCALEAEVLTSSPGSRPDPANLTVVGSGDSLSIAWVTEGDGRAQIWTLLEGTEEVVGHGRPGVRYARPALRRVGDSWFIAAPFEREDATGIDLFSVGGRSAVVTLPVREPSRVALATRRVGERLGIALAFAGGRDDERQLMGLLPPPGFEDGEMRPILIGPLAAGSTDPVWTSTELANDVAGLLIAQPGPPTDKLSLFRVGPELRLIDEAARQLPAAGRNIEVQRGGAGPTSFALIAGPEIVVGALALTEDAENNRLPELSAFAPQGTPTYANPISLETGSSVLYVDEAGLSHFVALGADHGVLGSTPGLFDAGEHVLRAFVEVGEPLRVTWMRELEMDWLAWTSLDCQ